jgi:hypothetical protein
MHRCGFLGLRFIHRQKLPTSRNATRNSRSTLHHSVGPRGTRIPPGIAFLASPTLDPAAASGNRGASVPFIRTRSGLQPSIPRGWPLSRCDHGDHSQRPPRVPFSSDQGCPFVDPDQKRSQVISGERNRAMNPARHDFSPSSSFSPPQALRAKCISPADRRLEKKPSIVRFVILAEAHSHAGTTAPVRKPTS